VKPWGEDECMIWNSPLPDDSATTSIGARATAWDGTEDPDTGAGGNIWIGTVNTGMVYKLDGANGLVLQSASIGIGAYGGAVDGRGGFWVVAMGCTIGMCRIGRVDMTTLEMVPHQVPCGYGISVDKWGRIWTSGLNCVNRFDPATETSQTLQTPGNFNRGIAVDNNGYVWAAVTSGNVLQVTEDTVELVNQFHVGPEAVVGVAVDFFGYIWAISQGGNEALKIDPVTYEVQECPVGSGPYTYSDMTGFQLSTVIFL
jgi:streptogramin lyase